MPFQKIHYDELAKDMVVYIKRKNGTIDYVTFDSDTIFTTNSKIPDKHKHKYQLADGFEDTYEGLRNYMGKLLRWIREFFCESKMMFGIGLRYTLGFSHNSSVMSIFHQLVPSKFYDFIEQVNLDESEWIEKCHNGGLQYCQPQTCESFSYDFKSMYPSCLTQRDFFISSKGGTEIILDKMPSYDDLYMGYGYIRCKITCTDPDIKKLIAFSKNHVYTDITIMFVYELQKKMDIKMDLIIDGKPNAYIYNKDDLIDTRDIFIVWFARLSKLKLKHPSNKLFKRCLSSLWGCLCQANTITKTEQQLEDENIDYDFFGTPKYIVKNLSYNADGTQYYELVNRENPYLHNLARIKASLTSYVRIKTARTALLKLDKVIRIHTDSICFSEPFNYKNIYGLLPEEKSSGNIKWINVNEYEKVE